MRPFFLYCAALLLWNIPRGISFVSKIPSELINDDTRDTLIHLNCNETSLSVYVKYPSNKLKGTIIALPGWNLPVNDWCNKTCFCKYASEKGYILVLPEMGKSIYSQQIYSNTKKEWQYYATRQWFIDSLIPYFQKKFNLLLPGNNNYIVGLSTGARGAALLSLDCPKIFKKIACLSGDYDQTAMPNDALMNGYYGTYNKYKERWIGPDNIVLRCKELKMPIYLGHGKMDKVVPYSQTIELIDSLKKYKPNLVNYNINEKAGHTYEYWNSEIENILLFFNNNN